MTIFNIIYVIAAVVVAFGACHFPPRTWPFLGRAKARHEGGGICHRLRPENLQLEARWHRILAALDSRGRFREAAANDHLRGARRQNPTKQIPPAPPLHKILVAFAGPFMNVVFAFAIATLIYFVGLPGRGESGHHRLR